MTLPWPDNPYGYSTNGPIAQCNLDVATSLNMSFVRRIINWSGLEPTEGTFDATTLAQLDAEVQLAHTNQINYTYVIEQAAAWANAGGSNPNFHNGCANFDPNKTLGFVQWLLNRYNGNGAGFAHVCPIARIELGNEGYSDKGDGNACQSFENVVPVAKLVYPWVKANYPDVLVGSPAHYNRGQSDIIQTHGTFYTGFYGSIKGYLDYMNYHWYGQVNDGTNFTGPDGVQQPGNDTFNQEWQDIHSVDVTNGNGNIPIYVTETGIAVPGGSGVNTEADKACFFASGDCGVNGAYTQGVFDDGRESNGVLTHICIWTIQNSNGYSITQGCGNITYLPAYNAILTYVQQYPQWANVSPLSDTVTGKGTMSGTLTAKNVLGVQYTGVGQVLPLLSLSISIKSIFTMLGVHA